MAVQEREYNTLKCQREAKKRWRDKNKEYMKKHKNAYCYVQIAI